MARLTRAYLSALFDIEDGKRRVWAVPGRLTALLRDKWRLNELLGEEDGQTGYADHRQRSIDALIAGCTDRSMLKHLSDAARKLEEDENPAAKRDELVTDLPPPFDSFRDQLEQHLKRMVISYKPDHGGADKAIRAAHPYTVAPLHKQTAYGLIDKPGDHTPAFATRVSVESLLRESDIECVGDAEIREKLLAAVEGLKEGGAEWKQAVEKAALPGGIMKNGIRRIRLHVEKTPGTMVGIVQPPDKGRDGAQPFKFYELRGNYCAEIYCTDKGKKAGQWQCEIISNYHAHQKTFIPTWRKENPTARLIMRLHTDDIVVYEKDGSEVIARVKKLAKLKNGGDIYLRPHTIAREELSKLSWGASAAQLQLRKARKISVDIVGRVKDAVRMKKKAAVA
jgi:CRISPR-associated endonuclease Csn1